MPDRTIGVTCFRKQSQQPKGTTFSTATITNVETFVLKSHYKEEKMAHQHQNNQPNTAPKHVFYKVLLINYARAGVGSILPKQHFQNTSNVEWAVSIQVLNRRNAKS